MCDGSDGFVFVEGEIIANTWIKFGNQVLDVFCSVDLGLLELPYKGWKLQLQVLLQYEQLVLGREGRNAQTATTNIGQEERKCVRERKGVQSPDCTITHLYTSKDKI